MWTGLTLHGGICSLTFWMWTSAGVSLQPSSYRADLIKTMSHPPACHSGRHAVMAGSFQLYWL